MSAVETRAAVSELLAEYFARTDRIVNLPIDPLFALGGRMRLGALVRDGREEIAAYFADRRVQEDAGGRKTRHVMSNLVVEALGAGAARVRFQCLVFAGVGDFPLPSQAPATIADFAADCVRQADAWLIAELRGRVTFTGVNAATFAR